MNRRAILGGLAALAGTARAQETGWGYVGPAGPANWGRLAESFRACADGTQQSPIDIRGSVGAAVPPAEPLWRATPLDLVNAGPNMALMAEPGSAMLLDGRRFDLLSLHFHNPSEHTVDGQSSPMSIHAVHRSAEGDLAVLGLFVRVGATNAALAPLWARLPLAAGAHIRAANTSIDLPGLLPVGRRQYRYAGSLTTPPCSENVSWAVLTTPIEISPDQLRAYTAAFPPNARPVQPLNRRFVLSTG